jgi:hypothetical protein
MRLREAKPFWVNYGFNFCFEPQVENCFDPLWMN